MSKEKRCEDIMQVLLHSTEAVSATSLAKQFHVSRQVIVQDIALLRARKIPILATARGYVLPSDPSFTRVIEVQHNDQQIEEELTTIVDLGGKIIDVFIKHISYGTISANLSIKSRLDIQLFLEVISKGESRPLKNLTAEHHFHTISADNNEVLDLIEQALDDKGYLIHSKGQGEYV